MELYDDLLRPQVVSEIAKLNRNKKSKTMLEGSGKSYEMKAKQI